MVKIGSVWRSAEDKQFIVINTVNADGHDWVHYRDHNLRSSTAESREYSCYEESFINRFSLVVA